MICPKKDCDGELRVTHTFDAGKNGKTQRLVCEQCSRPTTAVTFLRDGEGYGNGASAQAKKLKYEQYPEQASKRSGS